MAVYDVINKHTVDMSQDTNYYFEVAPQGDSQSRYVDVTLTTNGSTAYNVPAGATVILEGKNAGGFNIFINCQYGSAVGLGSNEIRIPLHTGVLSYAGVGKYQVGIYSGSTYITSFPFNIVVTEAPYDIVTVQASDVYEALQLAIAKAMASNKWIVGAGNPTISSTGGDEGDYYLNSTDGTLWQCNRNASTGALSWAKIVVSGKDQNIMMKLYIRYATNSSGGSMGTTPANNKPYIGFFATVLPSTDSAVSTASNYTWSLYRDDVTAVAIEYATNNSYTTAPTTWQATIPSVSAGRYLWSKITFTYRGGATFTYNTVTRYGSNGTSISSVAKTSTSGLVDTYTITFSNSTTTTFNVTNGKGITSISGPTTTGLNDKYTINYNDGTTSTFTVKNGRGITSITGPTTSGLNKTYTINYNDSTTSTFVVTDGTSAGFGTPTATISTPNGKPSVSVTASGANTAKVFAFTFKVRGGRWNSGTDISTSGASTAFTSSTAIIGDMYLNVSSGDVFRCTGTTASDSTWNLETNIGAVASVNDLNNTRRYFGELAANNTSNAAIRQPLQITNPTSDPIFVASDINSNTVDYRIRFLSSDPNVYPTAGSKVTITNGFITADLIFNTIHSAKVYICLEVIKKTR